MNRYYLILLGILLLCCSGCSNKSKKALREQTIQPAGQAATTDSSAGTAVVERSTFTDAHGELHEYKVDSLVPKHSYELSNFVHSRGRVSYQDNRYHFRTGIDVSRHQGKIRWKKVKRAGIDFAMLRIGFRGYGEEGRLALDEQFVRNIRQAQANDIEVGVYFFAQAVNEEEANEEADFVLDALAGYQLQLPVVYDPESILNAKARTDGVSGRQFTKNTQVFCKRIQNAGFQPMIYCNMMWEAYKLKLSMLSEYPVWYADYEEKPQTPYYFTMWQYTDKANVPGIDGPVDLDIYLEPAEG